MYTTILVPLDGSPRAEKILAHVEALAVKFGAKVILLQVVEPNVAMVTPYDMVPYYDPAEAEHITEEARTYLATKEAELKSLGLTVKSVTESGPVVSVARRGRA